MGNGIVEFFVNQREKKKEEKKRSSDMSQRTGVCGADAHEISMREADRKPAAINCNYGNIAATFGSV